MDCYTGEWPSNKRPQLPAAELRPALVDFFDIPREMWPLPFRISMKAMELDEYLRELARPLLLHCAKASVLL